MRRIVWTGCVFNGCEVLEPSDLDKTTSKDFYNVKCGLCGEIFQTFPKYLRAGNTRSCGCLKQKTIKKRFTNKKSYIGFTNSYGVKVIRPLIKEKDNWRDQWIGECPHCKILFQSRLHNLVVKIKSCGCLHLKQSSENCQKINSLRRVERGNTCYEPLSPKIHLLRNMLFKKVGKLVLKMDNFTCQFCSKRGGYMNVHHIEPICQLDINNPESLQGFYKLENLITLCRNCHEKEAHVGCSINLNLINKPIFEEKAKNRFISEELLEEYSFLVKDKITPWLTDYFDKEK